jgi:hypothetical protein
MQTRHDQLSAALNKARQRNLPTTDVCQWLCSGSARSFRGAWKALKAGRSEIAKTGADAVR